MFIVWNPKQASATQLEDEICSASEKGPLKQKLKRQHSIWNINWNRFFFHHSQATSKDETETETVFLADIPSSYA